MDLTAYGLYVIIVGVSWVVEIGDKFKAEFFALQEDVRTEILALTRLLQRCGPPCSLRGISLASAKSGSTAS